MIQLLLKSSLRVQLPLLATAFSLLVALALVALAVTSSRFLLEEQRHRHGEALAQQLASVLLNPLESGDLLAIAASLQQLASSGAVQRIALYDAEERILGEAGNGTALVSAQYTALVRIGSDVAGRVVVELPTQEDSEAQFRLILSLVALAVLLSLLVYAVARWLAQGMAAKLDAMAEALAMDTAAQPGATETGQQVQAAAQAEDPHSSNELSRLELRVDALPMALLRAHVGSGPRAAHYRTHSVLYVHLSSLSAYVDALNERNLQRYTDRLHRIIHAAASAYQGELQVARQFGLILCFRAQRGRGAHVLRAAACARLIQRVTEELQRSISLSLGVGMAIGQSETGPGDANDIYPGLYLQSVTDSLRDACAEEHEHILISPELATDKTLRKQAQLHPLPQTRYLRLGALSEAQSALIERQQLLLVNRLRPGSRGR